MARKGKIDQQQVEDAGKAALEKLNSRKGPRDSEAYNRAFELYVLSNRSAEETARLISMPVRTVHDWIAKGGWASSRVDMQQGRSLQLAYMYNKVAELMRIDSTMPPEKQYNDCGKLADAIGKYNNMIERLEERLASKVAMMEACKALVDWVRRIDPKEAARLVELMQQYTEANGQKV